MNVGVLVREAPLVLFRPVGFAILMNATKGKPVWETVIGVLIQAIKLLQY